MVLADGKVKLAFGNAVRARRLAAGLSQEALAEQADIHRTYMSDVERGTRNVALLNMLKIASALRIPLSDLIHDMEGQSGGAS